MNVIKYDLSENRGKFRIMHAVNNGPVHKRHANDQKRSNLDSFKAARIPYARNHDAAFNAGYGGEHTVDISAIFPNFDADPYDPASYDFACTDEYIAITLEAGTETFYRLGQKIEHYIKKFNVYPPKDFKKWAVICEHIIRHYNYGWADDFLCEMSKRGVPIDFFSWHIYTNRVPHVAERAAKVKDSMVKYGYGDAESILNEWNYVNGWSGDEFVYTIEQIIGLKGASFTLAVMCESQRSDIIDMLMYYDARPSAFNGLWDFYTLRPLRGYYPFLWYADMYELDHEVRCDSLPEDIYSLAGVSKEGKVCAVATYYTNDDNAEPKTFTFDFGKEGEYDVYLLSADSDPMKATRTKDLTFTLDRCVSILVKEV